MVELIERGHYTALAMHEDMSLPQKIRIILHRCIVCAAYRIICTTVSFEHPGQCAMTNVPDCMRGIFISQTMKLRQLLKDYTRESLAV